MHLVHVQGGASAKGVPAGSQSASLFALSMGLSASSSANSSATGPAGPVTVGGPLGGPGSTGGIRGSVAGVGASSSGAASSAAGGIAGSGKPGAPGGGPSGVGGSGGPNAAGGAGGSNASQAGTDFGSAMWCLIDDGAVGTSATTVPSSSASGVTSNNPSVTNTPINNAGFDLAPKRRAVLVEVERDIEALITKLKNLWVHRQHAQVEGQIYDLGDFIVRAGNIMVASTSYKGMLIEVEYLPQTSSATASNAILEEFVRLISPPGVNLFNPQILDYPYDQVGLDPKHWSMLHNGFQYMTLFRRQHIL
ncbi:hypothetical protein BGW38_004973 [Lunasporangiospora selenospora]|uniref:Mediator of RNA polymerase II transcription subunit 20 n=1 Tax=Lunasporangiospora selenospora TaxID=979761 RepID=A0A9P6FNL9_9FUNG|nr:hypothetical protein BGW38_004973 [Lunasporangiospora selenospora]